MKALLRFGPASALAFAASLAVAAIGCSSSSSNGGTGGTTGSGGSASGGATGSGGSGSGGTIGSGGSGSGGMVVDAPVDSPAGDVSDGGPVAAMAQATIVATGGGTITGTVTFVTVANGVQVTYALENCPAGVHPTHIHDGATCGADGLMAGGHWATPRGDNIGSGAGQITCTADMKGAMTYTRPSTPANAAWTIGAPAASNIVGHTLMVHGVNDTNQRYGCGPIVMK